MMAEALAHLAALPPALALAPLALALTVALLAPSGRASAGAVALAAVATLALLCAGAAGRWPQGLEAAWGWGAAGLVAAMGLSALSAPASEAVGDLRAARLEPALTVALLAAAASAPLMATPVDQILALQLAALAGAALLASASSRAGSDAGLRLLPQAGLGGALALIGAVTPQGALLTEAAGAAALVAGLALLAGLAPAHLTALASAPSAHQGPAAMAVILLQTAGLAVLVGVALDFADMRPPVAAAAGYVFAGLAVVGVVVGSLQALAAQDLRRMLWAAGAAQAGLTVLALGLNAGSAATLQLAATGLSAALLAVAFSAICPRQAAPIDTLNGLARRSPALSVAISIAMLSFVGAPFTLGFSAKWEVLSAAIAAGWWWAAFLTLGAVLAAAIGAGRVLARLFARPPEDERAQPPRAAPVFAAFLLAIGLIASALSSGAVLDGSKARGPIGQWETAP